MLQTTREEIHLHLANLTPESALFIKGVLALFTVPEGAQIAQDVLAGRVSLMANPNTGEAYLVTAKATPPALDEIITFLQRLNGAEFRLLIQRQPDFLPMLVQDLTEASHLAEIYLNHPMHPTDHVKLARG